MLGMLTCVGTDSILHSFPKEASVVLVLNNPIQAAGSFAVRRE